MASKKFFLFFSCYFLNNFSKITSRKEVIKHWEARFFLLFLLYDWRIRISYEWIRIRIRNTGPEGFTFCVMLLLLSFSWLRMRKQVLIIILGYFNLCLKEKFSNCVICAGSTIWTCADSASGSTPTTSASRSSIKAAAAAVCSSVLTRPASSDSFRETGWKCRKSLRMTWRWAAMVQTREVTLTKRWVLAHIFQCCRFGMFIADPNFFHPESELFPS
jgi:hypothetical protein